MKKLDMKSKDILTENIDKLAELFPNVVTEAKDEKGRLIKSIDFDLLRQELSDHIVEGEKERYQLTWPGKKEAMLLANTPINKTLRPVREESQDWETTGNLYIEGDNLEALKILQESYLNKVKCIYIDPPYNTGKDFIYKDNFSQDRDEYLSESGQVDEEGNRLVQNNEANGRFHSDWLSMMYPRLKLAKKLLHEDGAIFVSVDDNEFYNLRLMMNEVFGERCFKNSIVVRRGIKSVQAQFDTIDSLTIGHEYILMYAKNPSTRFPNLFIPLKEMKSGAWNNHWRGTDRPTMRYELFGIIPETGQWRWGRERSMAAINNFKRMMKELQSKQQEITQEQIDEWYISERKKTGQDLDLLRLSASGKPEHYIPPTDSKLVSDLWIDLSTRGSHELKTLFDDKVFDNPKPTSWIKRIIKFVMKADQDDIILDFFSGSATTAHAVMQLNAEDGGNRKYIMVQLPEACAEDSEAYKAGFNTIADIGKERIRRAAKKIKEETGADIDYGFRVFKVDTSNMKDVYYRPDELSQQDLVDMVSNIKEDRTGEDLLIQVMLDWGLELSLPMEKKNIAGKDVYFVADNSLVACFAEDVSEELIREIAKVEPLRVVFRDSCFADDAARINVEELFKMLSSSTEIRVI